MTLSPEERELAARIGFDESVLELVKAEDVAVIESYREDADFDNAEIGKSALLVSPRVHEGDFEKVFAHSFGEEPQLLSELPTRQGAERHNALRHSLQSKLLPLGYRVFNHEYKIIVLRTRDQFDVLRLTETNGANYDLDTDDVIAKLQEWDARLGVSVTGANFSSVAVKFSRLPDDVRAFALEINEFCPDTLGQNFGGIYHEMDEDELTELGLEYDETLDEPEAGLELLTAHLQQTKSVFLWWD